MTELLSGQEKLTNFIFCMHEVNKPNQNKWTGCLGLTQLEIAEGRTRSSETNELNRPTNRARKE